MRKFETIEALRARCGAFPEGDSEAAQRAVARQRILTKPQGSLGRLEDIAVELARWQGREHPRLEKVHVLVFAGSHGITTRGVSAFPAEVTAQMVANFSAGGAAVNQLALTAGAELAVLALAVDRPTDDFTEGEAMTEEELLETVSAGYAAVPDDADLVALGEMGIGNTTVAATLAAALFGGTGRDWAGRGTGVDDQGLSRKVATVDAALARHANALNDPLRVLQAMGGRELAAMFGAILSARHKKIPVVLDGYVCGAAAAVLFRLAPEGLEHALAGHVSAETAHRKLLEAMGLSPLLDLNMRLGEASGACVAILLLRAALACHNDMASFAEAGVSDA